MQPYRIMLNKLTSLIRNNIKTKIIILLIILISGVSHGYNMLHFPYYENDEGVYMSQAWSLIEEGKLAPYTYWYDHAPAGWILIALWTKLTGGFFTFGLSVNSGRVLMLILHIATSLMLYFITKKITKSTISGLLAVVLFSFTPLGIYFQRRVLLDNIMTFWLFVSLSILFKDKLKLSDYIISSITFGIAILSKENAIFFLPVLLYLILLRSHFYHKGFAVFHWLAISLLIVSTYFLYALLKGELFPVGFMGNNAPHVSLITTLKDQMQRGGGAGPLDFAHNAFGNNMRIWSKYDPIIIVLGVISTFFNILLSYKNRALGFVGFLSLVFWIFLIRGGIVIEFYIVPLIPILALNIAVWCNWLRRVAEKVLKNNSLLKNLAFIPDISILLIAVMTLFIFGFHFRNKSNLFKSDQTTPQKEAVEWMLSRKTPDDFFIIDNYAYVDLHQKAHGNFKYAEWYWKVDRDPEIKQALLKGSPQGVGYIALTPQMEHDITTAGLDLSLAAWHNSKLVKSFWNEDWGVEFWATQYPGRILNASWDNFKKKFILNGRVLDPSINGDTTSEAQSYALLRSVWSDDKQTFDDLYAWTNIHLKQENNLFSWKWTGSDDSGKIVDDGTATDADTDIALALLFANKKWGGINYLEDAKKILSSIWQYEVVELNNTPYLSAGNWANNDDFITINPSYFSPASYRIFSNVDPGHEWLKLTDSSYKILIKCTQKPLNKNAGLLPPEWCAIDKKTDSVIESESPQPVGTDYSYNSFRTPWRIALDYKWFNSPEAKSYLEGLTFLHKEWTENGRIVTAYTHDGKVWENYESAAAYGANIAYFSILYPDIANDIYTNKILNKFYEDEKNAYWEDPNNYYTQNWAWFGTAFYSGLLPNLWSI